MHFLAHGTHAYIHTISILLVHVDVPSAPGVVTGRRATSKGVRLHCLAGCRLLFS
jgi:hypothetical protein